MTKLLVLTGDGFFTGTVEVINLDEANPDLICDNLPEYPYPAVNAMRPLEW